MNISIIIILVLILLIVGGLIFLYLSIKNKVELFSRRIFGTKNILEGFKKQEIEYENTPKSLSGMDTILIPKINKDFPSINIDELKKTAENAIILYFESLKDRKLKEIPNASDKLNNMISSLIVDNKHIYKDVKIHRTVINSYDNKNGVCIITFQTSLEYSKDSNKIQDRLNTDLIYIYDDKKGNVSLNCPNCGAPVTKIGIKVCEYCNTGIVEMLSKTWRINDIYQK